MIEDNNKNFSIGILVIIIIALVILLVLSLMGVISFVNNDNKCVKEEGIVLEKSETTYAELAGIYDSEKMEKDAGGNDILVKDTLYLWKNGTFHYVVEGETISGVMGNYIVEKGNIKLNYLFNTHTGADINVTSGNRELTINNDKTITSNTNFLSEDSEKIIFKRSTVTNIVSENDFVKILEQHQKHVDK